MNRTDRAREKGMAAIAAAGLIVMLCIAALVVDYGFILANRTDLSKAVDAAALAGAQDLPNQATAAGTATNFVGLNVTGAPAPTITITFPAVNVIRVNATKPSSAFFSSVFGITDLTVGSVAEATRLEPNIAIVIDRSGSMCSVSRGAGGGAAGGGGGGCGAGPWQPFSTIQDIAKGFVDEFQGDPQMSLISFSNTVTLDVPLTADKTVIKNGIDALRPGGSTDIASAISQGIDQLINATGKGPSIIVLMTDGVPNFYAGKSYSSGSTVPQDAVTSAAQAAAAQGVIVHTINYGSKVDNTLMAAVATTTQGTFYNAPDTAELAVIYAEIAAKNYVKLTYVH